MHTIVDKFYTKCKFKTSYRVKSLFLTNFLCAIFYFLGLIFSIFNLQV